MHDADFANLRADNDLCNNSEADSLDKAHAAGYRSLSSREP
jgi:hypothetical protein